MALDWITILFQDERFEVKDLLVRLEQMGHIPTLEWAEEAFPDPDFPAQLVAQAERELKSIPWTLTGPVEQFRFEALVLALVSLYEAEYPAQAPAMAPPGRPLRNSPLASRAGAR